MVERRFDPFEFDEGKHDLPSILGLSGATKATLFLDFGQRFPNTPCFSWTHRSIGRKRIGMLTLRCKAGCRMIGFDAKCLPTGEVDKS